MPRTSEMIESKFLRKEDFDEDGTVTTIASFQQENVAQADQPQEMKWIMYFNEFEKGLVLNSTNIKLAEKACGSDDTDDWVGKKIIVYVDPNVQFKGELKGGLRLRAHRQSKPPREISQPSMSDVNRDLNANARRGDATGGDPDF